MIGICPVPAIGNVKNDRKPSGLKEELMLMVRSRGVSGVELVYVVEIVNCETLPRRAFNRDVTSDSLRFFLTAASRKTASIAWSTSCPIQKYRPKSATPRIRIKRMGPINANSIAATPFSSRRKQAFIRAPVSKRCG